MPSGIGTSKSSFPSRYGEDVTDLPVVVGRAPVRAGDTDSFAILKYPPPASYLELDSAKASEGPRKAIFFSEWLAAKGLTASDLDRITKSLPSVFELSFAFGPYTIGDETLSRLGMDPAAAKADPKFNLLRKLGLREAQIETLNS